MENRIILDDKLYFGQLVREASLLIGASESPHIVLDFKNLSHASSAILGAVVALSEKIKFYGGTINIENANESVRNQLGTVGMVV